MAEDEEGEVHFRNEEHQVQRVIQPGEAWCCREPLMVHTEANSTQGADVLRELGLERNAREQRAFDTIQMCIWI